MHTPHRDADQARWGGWHGSQTIHPGDAFILQMPTNTAPQPYSSPECYPSHEVPQGSPTSAGACFPSSVPGSTPATANNGTAESVSPPNNTLLFYPLNGSVGLRAAPLRRNAVSS